MNTPDLPKTIFVDIDGTIIKHHGGLENSLNELLKPDYKPELLENVQERIWEWDGKDYTVILTTGRKESSRRITEKQLEELQKKMFFVKKDIEVTNLVIEIINDESRDILRVLREDKFLLEQKNES